MGNVPRGLRDVEGRSCPKFLALRHHDRHPPESPMFKFLIPVAALSLVACAIPGQPNFDTRLTECLADTTEAGAEHLHFVTNIASSPTQAPKRILFSIPFVVSGLVDVTTSRSVCTAAANAYIASMELDPRKPVGPLIVVKVAQERYVVKSVAAKERVVYTMKWDEKVQILE